MFRIPLINFYIRKLQCVANIVNIMEYETPNFLIITSPEDFALITALYRSSVDGRRFMYEAILSEDGTYNIPDKFTSRTAEILEVYLKSLGIKMETIHDDSEYIRESDHNEIVGYTFGANILFCTPNDMYLLKKLIKVYKRYKKEHPYGVYDIDDVWDYTLENLPFDKEELNEDIINLFKNNLTLFN